MRKFKELTYEQNRKIGLVISYATIFVHVLISIFFTPFILRSIGDRQYGLFSFSLSITSWLPILLVAFGSGYTKYLSREKQEKGDIGEHIASGLFFKIFLGIGFLIILAGSILFCLLWFNVIELKEYNNDEHFIICIIILFSFITILITTLLTSFKSFLFYKESYIAVYCSELIGLLFQILVTYLCLRSGLGVISLALVQFSCAILISIYQSIVSICIKKYKMKLILKSDQEKQLTKSLFKEISVFTFFMLINTIVTNINKTMDVTLLGFFNADSVATYQLSYNLSNYMVTLSTAIGIVQTQHMNDVFFSDGGQKAADTIYKKITLQQIFITFLITGGFLSCGKEFVCLWIGEERIDVFYVSLCLFLIHSLTSVGTLSTHNRALQNLHKKASFIILLGSLANFIISFILCSILPRANAIWYCVIGTAISMVLFTGIILNIYDFKYTKLSIPSTIKNYFYVLLIALVSSIAPLLIRNFIGENVLNNLSKFFINGFIYVLTFLILLLIFYKNDISQIFEKIKKKFINKKTDF